MVTRLVDSSTATTAEVFRVPEDYPVVETESGAPLPSGKFYWWYLQESGAPDTYPAGPFDCLADALEDWSMAGAWEPVDDEN